MTFFLDKSMPFLITNGILTAPVKI